MRLNKFQQKAKPSVDLDINETPSKITARHQLIGFDALGGKLQFTPQLHVSRTSFSDHPHLADVMHLRTRNY